MFKLYALSVNILTKTRAGINKVIISREQSEKYLTQDILFAILSLADQLYRSQSTTPDRPEFRKINFSKNLAPDL